jgi:hypothetical protein
MNEKTLDDVVRAVESLRYSIEMTNFRLESIEKQFSKYHEYSFAQELLRTLNGNRHALEKRIDGVADLMIHLKGD